MAKTGALPILAIITATIALVVAMCGLCVAAPQPQEANEYYYGASDDGWHEDNWGYEHHHRHAERLVNPPQPRCDPLQGICALGNNNCCQGQCSINGNGATLCCKPNLGDDCQADLDCCSTLCDSETKKCAEPPGVLQTLNFDDSALYTVGSGINGQTIEGFVWEATGDVFVGTATVGNTLHCEIGGVITTTPTPLTNGYINGIVSQPAALLINQATTFAAAYVCASNGAGEGKAFIPQSIQATAAWRDGVTLTATGYDASRTAGTTLTATINYGAPTSIDLTSLGQIYSMSFVSSGGQFACVDFTEFGPDAARQFALDDFVVRSDIGPGVPVTCTPPFARRGPATHNPGDAAPSLSAPKPQP